MTGRLPDADGGVPDAEHEGIPTRSRAFLRCPVHDQNPNQRSECMRLSSENQERDVRELSRDLRNFDWVGEAVFR